MKTDSMQTRMKMDRKRKRAAGTVTRNVRCSSVFWRERGGGERGRREGRREGGRGDNRKSFTKVNS